MGPFMQLPQTIIQYALLEPFVHDLDAIHLLTTSKQFFHHRTNYDLKTRFQLRLTTNDYQTTKEEFIAPLSLTCITLPCNRPWVTHSYTTSSTTIPTPLPPTPSLLVGRVTRIRLDCSSRFQRELTDERLSVSIDTNKKCLIVHPQLIPTSVRSIEMEDGWSQVDILYLSTMIDLKLVELIHAATTVTVSGYKPLFRPTHLSQFRDLTRLTLRDPIPPFDFTHLSVLKYLVVTVECQQESIDQFKLPESLEDLILDLFMSKPLAGLLLPSGLKTLWFSWDDKSIEWNWSYGQFHLPDSITDLNCPLTMDPRLLPPHLIFFLAPSKFTLPFSEVHLPQSLLHFSLLADNTQITEGEIAELVLPKRLQTLDMTFKDESFYKLQLPQSLTELIYWGDFLLTTNCKRNFLGATPHLTILDLSHAENPKIQHLNYWPPSLRILRLGSKFDQDITGLVLPASIEELVIDSTKWNGALPKAGLPTQLRKLQLTQFQQIGLLDQLHYQRLPHLTSLTLGNTTSESSLPELSRKLRILHFTTFSAMTPSFNPRLPESLTSLDLGPHFTRALTGRMLPDSLTSLAFGPPFCGKAGTISPSFVFPTGPSRNVLMDTASMGYRMVTPAASKFNHSLQAFILPASLQSLDLSATEFNHPIDDLVLPPDFRRLVLPRAFECDITRFNRSIRRLRVYYDIVDTGYGIRRDHEDLDLTSTGPIYLWKKHGQRWNQTIAIDF